METILEIQNLKCGGCAHTITKKLTELVGITNITVDTNSSSININSTNEEALEEAKTLLYKLGYPVQGDNNSFGTKAKSFVSCAIGRIEKS